ncbi:cyclin-T1-3-like [Olea europaea var. sylvestris]|nr:cyclin-T1-3-like [Olea europaea var. sylvestris]
MESIPDHEGDDDIDDFQHHQREGLPDKGNLGEIQNKSRFRSDEHVDEDRDRSLGGFETRNTVELKDKYSSRTLAPKDGTVSQSPQDAIKKIDKEKVKAALERRKARGDINRKTDHMDELERELEDVELPGEFDKIKLENKRSWSKSTNKSEHENSHRPSGYGHADDFHTVEEGEVEPFDDDRGYQSPRLANRKRKAGSPLDKKVDGKLRIDYMCGSQTHH